MANLSEEDRLRVWRALMRYWSQERAIIATNKHQLRDAVDATDAWIEENQGDYNATLPLPARTDLTASQKTLLFCAVALARVDPGLAALLRRALGVEVD